MNEKLNKETAWDIIKGKKTLPEAMKIFGDDNEIDKIMSEIKADKINALYYGIGLEYMILAYKYLVKIGEIKRNEIFSLSGDFSLQYGDMGLRGKKIYIFNGKKWEEL